MCFRKYISLIISLVLRRRKLDNRTYTFMIFAIIANSVFCPDPVGSETSGLSHPDPE